MSAEEIAAALLPGWPRFRGEPYVREDMGTWVVKARWPESVRESDNAVATGATVQIACQKLLDWRRTFLEQIEAEKEKAHAEIPRPVHDGSASAGDGAGSEPAAATDHPDPAGSGLGLAGAQDQPTDQDSAANASKPAVDAEFSEPEAPPQAQAIREESVSRETSEQDGGTVIEGHKPADPPAYGGTLIDDTRERLSAEVDAEARARIDACDTVLRDTPMSEINNARMYGAVTDAQAAQEATYYAAQTRRVAVAETAAKLKRALWEMAPDRLSTFKPGEPSLWPT